MCLTEAVTTVASQRLPGTMPGGTDVPFYAFDPCLVSKGNKRAADWISKAQRKGFVSTRGDLDNFMF